MSRLKTKYLVHILIIFSCFLLLFVNAGIFTSLKFTIIKVVSLPVRVLSFPFKEAKKILFYHRTFDEYLRLNKQVDILKERLMGLEEVLRENNRLEQLLNFRRKLVYSAVAANVIGRDPSNWSATMIIG